MFYQPKKSIIVMSLMCMSVPNFVFAQDAQETEIVISTRTPSLLKTLPASVSVLTAADLQNTTHLNLAGLLNTLVGVSSIKGSGAQASVDIRGFGMTASSNTLILINGVRLNTDDLSAADLSSISLDSIERIELIRGQGSVQYGNGATAGVINIITKAPLLGTHGQVTLSTGLNDLFAVDANLSIANELWFSKMNVSGLINDHVRENQSEKNQNIGVQVGSTNQAGTWLLEYANTHSNNRFPGARKVDPSTGLNEFLHSPKQTSTPDDAGHVEQDRLALAWNKDFNQTQLRLNSYLRKKTTDTFTDAWGSQTTDNRSIKEFSFAPSVAIPFEFLNNTHTTVLGMESLQGDLHRASDVSGAYPSDVRTKGKTKQLGFYIDQSGLLSAQTSYEAGVRFHQFSNHLTQVDSSGFNNAQVDEKKTVNAWQFGLKHAVGKWAVWGRASQSFRLPNSDELVGAGGLNLKAQTSHDFEVGSSFTETNYQARVSLFTMMLKNEIQYNPFGGLSGYGANINLDKTARHGIEVEGKWQLNPSWQVLGNYSWIDARFDGDTATQMNRKRIPLIAQSQTKWSLQWQPSAQHTLGTQLHWRSSMKLDNDQNNDFAHDLGSVFTTNLYYRYQQDALSFRVGVNNVFNKLYANYGVRSTFGSNYNLYPEDRRNISASLTYSF